MLIRQPENEPIDDEGEWIHPYIHESEKNCMDNDCSDYYFEKSFDLVNDEVLLRAGVEICAVTVIRGSHVKNMIKFKQADYQSVVDCIHTTVCQFVFDSESEDGIEILSTERHPDLKWQLAPEEHYVAMKSFVGYLAEKGIINSLVLSYKTEFEQGQEPVDFNHLMRQQLMRALSEIAPEVDTDLVFLILKHVSEGDLVRLKIILSEITDSFDYLFQRENLPESLIHQFLISGDSYIINELSLSDDLLYKFGRDEDSLVRAGIAERITLPPDLVHELATDESARVRLILAQNIDMPEDVIRTLAEDMDSRVRERSALTALKQMINKPIPHVEDISYKRVGSQDLEHHVIELSLRRCELTTLPEAIGELKSLETVDLGRNNLRTLPESFGELKSLKSLKSLNVSENQLVSLPGSFGELKLLQTLDLSENKLETLPETFGQLKSLKSLSLSKNQLMSLPESFGELQSLEGLALQDNQLMALPESFGELKSLKSLNLNWNRLTKIPESFSEFKSLESLDLICNIKTLPEWFGKLTSLKSLTLGSNQLKTLPKSFGELKLLKTLHMGKNQLSVLPESFGELKLLRALSLCKNHLSILPESFGELKSLEFLDLSYNHLTRLPESFGMLKALEYLHMPGNRLTTLPVSFGELTSLSELRPDDNPWGRELDKIIQNQNRNSNGNITSVAPILEYCRQKEEKKTP